MMQKKEMTSMMSKKKKVMDKLMSNRNGQMDGKGGVNNNYDKISGLKKPTYSNSSKGAPRIPSASVIKMNPKHFENFANKPSVPTIPSAFVIKMNPKHFENLANKPSVPTIPSSNRNEILKGALENYKKGKLKIKNTSSPRMTAL